VATVTPWALYSRRNIEDTHRTKSSVGLETGLDGFGKPGSHWVSKPEASIAWRFAVLNQLSLPLKKKKSVKRGLREDITDSGRR